jgi:hypothetical protein
LFGCNSLRSLADRDREDVVAAVLRSLALLTFIALAGCVTSKAPLLGPDSRVLPFLPGTTFETYEREDPRAPWKKNARLSAFTADESLVVREVTEAGQPKNDEIYTFHALGFERFLVQAQFKRGEAYAYGVLEIRNGEGVITGLGCKAIDQAAFRAGGGKIANDFCELDSAPDPLALLRTIAANPAGVQVRYVPVTK